MNNKTEKTFTSPNYIIDKSHPNYKEIKKALLDKPYNDSDVTFISDVGLYDNYNDPYEQALAPEDILVDLHEGEAEDMQLEPYELSMNESDSIEYYEALNHEDLMVDDAFEVTANEKLEIATKEMLSDLSVRETKTINSRFGIDSSRELSLEETGISLEVGTERVRQIEAKALRKLRHPSRSSMVHDFMYPDSKFENAYIEKQELKANNEEAAQRLADNEARMRVRDSLKATFKTEIHDIHLAIDKAERVDSVLYAKKLKDLLIEKLTDGKELGFDTGKINDECMDSSRAISETLSDDDLATEFEAVIEYENGAFGHTRSNIEIIEKIHNLHVEQNLAVKYHCPKYAKQLQSEITKIESGFGGAYFDELQPEIKADAKQFLKEMSGPVFKSRSAEVKQAEKSIENKITEGNNKRAAKTMGLSTHQFMTKDKNSQMNALTNIMHKVHSESENSF